MNVAIIKYNAGNIQSVLNTLNMLGVNAQVTDDVHILKQADKVIFPGVGAAASAMLSLKAGNLDRVIKTLTQPVLGICVGMQLLFDHSEEGDTPCLGIIPYMVKKFIPVKGEDGQLLKIPQIGWNDIYNLKSDLFKGIPENSFVYYVHSYYAEMNPYCVATSSYGLPYTGAVKKDNFYGVQFHTEKSSEIGMKILNNFLSL
jgi:glutamine amidotransferase